MPIEIRELIIRTHITDEQPANKRSRHSVGPDNEQEIIERCIDKIIRKLNKRKER